MSTKLRSLQVYEELATWYDRQGQAKLRDWFLVLAADLALTLGQRDLAERFRQRLLHANPHHLLRPFASFAEALQSADVKGYVADLRRNYPPETAEQLLQSTHKKKATEAPRPAAPPTRTKPAAEEERELKVYPSREPSDAALPVAEEVPVVEMPQPPPRAPARVTTPAARKRPAPKIEDEPAPLPREFLDDEGPTGMGFWVSSVLFVVTLLVGILLLVYTLLRPLVS
jgi:hypothetical protein